MQILEECFYGGVGVYYNFEPEQVFLIRAIVFCSDCKPVWLAQPDQRKLDRFHINT